MTVAGQAEEAASFPLDLDEEMVDKQHIYEESSLTHAIDGGLRRARADGAMPAEAGDEVVHEGMQEVPEPFLEEVTGGEDREEGTYAEIKHEEDIPETFQQDEGGEVQFETVDIGEEPHSTPVVMRVDAPSLPIRGVTFYPLLSLQDLPLRRVIILD